MTLTPLAPLPPYSAEMQQRGGSTDLLRKEVMYLIEKAIANHPRSLQKRIGPSEVGGPCKRRIGYKLLGIGPFNPYPSVPWKATIGTAVHAWLEERFTANGEDDMRWLTEMTVSVGTILGTDITGHVDLYDRCTATTLDWKVVGDTQLTKYKAKGPGTQYRCQGHLYGRGLTRRGAPVDQVVIAFLPRNKDLTNAYFWSEPYDERVALWALQRAEGIAVAVSAMGTAALPLLEPTENYCRNCPFHKADSTDLAQGCPGVDVQRPEPALTLAPTGGTA